MRSYVKIANTPFLLDYSNMYLFASSVSRIKKNVLVPNEFFHHEHSSRAL